MSAVSRLVGSSGEIEHVRRMIERVAPSRSPVLLQGETGTGKEVVARAIHDCAPLGAFVPIDCGSLVGPLVESELFGYVKGAFTGAQENKRGLIDLANGGTVFFDEIGDLPLEMQVKLLRLLQEREFRPVGSLKMHRVEIRVIAATHRNLPEEVKRGAFREDLFYRLNVVKISLPPLRDRRGDIPFLVDHFLRELGSSSTLTPEALRVMAAYDWPGNIRELRNSLERMTALSTAKVLGISDLPTPLQNVARSIDLEGDSPLTPPGDGNQQRAAHRHSRPGVRSMPEVEKQAIADALAYTRGDRAKAAQLLGIGRTTLYRKMKQYNLPE